MTERHLHIVSFDIPSPPNYGGVIDVYYKIKALHELGVKVHLHCFEYGRKLDKELTKICYSVKSYPRKVSKHLLFNQLPYIIVTRQSEVLISNLVKDKYPILFEGMHSCFYLNDFRLAHRKKYVRMHNIEAEYYKGLGSAEKNVLKKLYFYTEANKLKAFENSLKGAETIFAITEKDTAYLSNLNFKTHTVSAFHQFNTIQVKPIESNYALYHGNLSVGENNLAALYLVNEVFNDLPYNLIIAGNHPSKALRRAVSKNINVTLIADSDHVKINHLIAEAKINVLPTFQDTGIKLKLLNALYCGQHCLVNDYMVKGTGLEKLCVIANSPNEWKLKVENLFKTPFDINETNKRDSIFSLQFNNKSNASRIVEEIFGA